MQNHILCLLVQSGFLVLDQLGTWDWRQDEIGDVGAVLSSGLELGLWVR